MFGWITDATAITSASYKYTIMSISSISTERILDVLMMITSLMLVILMEFFLVRIIVAVAAVYSDTWKIISMSMAIVVVINTSHCHLSVCIWIINATTVVATASAFDGHMWRCY